MKPTPFEYHRAATVDEAIGLLARYGDEGKVLAGGQSLVPLLNFRLAGPAALIDVNRLGDLAYIRRDDGWLELGALTRQRDLERSEVVAAASPVLRDAVRLVGHPAIRSRGTVGGTLAHADPSAELPLLLLALDGSVRVRGEGGERTVPARDFFTDQLTTVLEPAELVVAARLRTSGSWDGGSFLELAPRHGDFALAAAAVFVARAQDGTCADARIAVGGAGPTPLRLHAAEASLRGQPLDAARFEEAARLAAAGTAPRSDVHASAAYRRRLARVLVRRALAEASARARGDAHSEETR